jgi:uncharacterized protein YcfJ
MRLPVNTTRIAAAGSLGVALAGCLPMNYTQSGAMVGSGLGAVTGAVIGGEGGHAAGGALAGAAIGALAGGLVGNSEDMRAEQDAAFFQASYAAQARAALTNFDVIRMAQSGVSDDVLIGAIQSRGGRFELSPDSIIQLKTSGVSDRVILSMQQPGAVSAPPPVVVVPQPAPPPVGIFVAPPPPPPPPGISFEFWSRGPHRHWR